MKINNFTKRYMKYLLLLFIAAVLYSCTEDPTETMWEINKNSGNSATPEISYVDVVSKGWPAPGEAGSFWASIDTIAIHGKNFGLDTTNQWVYFNLTKATIVSFSDSLLYVKAPALISDSVVVKVVKGTSEKWVSTSLKLKEAINTYYTFSKGEAARAVTFGKDNVLYASFMINGVGQGIYKLYKNEAGESVKEQYAFKGTETNWNSIKFLGTQLYGAKNLTGIWKIDPGVAPPNQPWAKPDKNIADFDIAANGMMYAAGAANVYRINPNSPTDIVKTTSTIVAQSVRVYDNYVYVGGNKGGVEGVWRFKIVDANTLGTEELFYNVSTNYTNTKVQGITFDQNGGLYIGTNNANPIIYVKNGSGSFLFPASLSPVAKWFTWVPGTQYLVFSQDVVLPSDLTNIYKVMTFNLSAPYYGIQ